ncbi:MFS transporter [Psychromarinibacter halotolerans]|uniref:MFS transporter n=1 Tax=Psychromarinibacter halotolerans TaxID=1775175 RepID=A0ABV7GJY0_9RHOB|nr:MFS transporter [Psychromarinibacter halotolerans]MDF0595853.1 MFS transporter [Psychromarinibacter halotolerans]
MGLLSFLRQNAPFLSAGAILTLCSSFGQTFFISIFAGEIRADYGLSHGAWGAIYAVSTMASAGVMLWAGTLTDRFRVRALGPWMLGLLVLACLAMALSPVVATLALTIFLLRFLGQGMMSHIAYVAMARWFVATRGRAVALAALGFSVGEAILPVTFVAMMGVIDWRWLWVVAALLPLAAIPLIRHLLKLERTPQSIAAEDPSPGMGGRYWTRAEALRHPLFWLLVPALLGPPAFGTAFFFQQVHLAEVKGWAHVELVAMFPFYTVTAIVSLFGTGWLMDRVGAGRLLPFYQLPLAGCFVLTPLVAQPIWMIAPLILFGIMQGSQNPIVTGFSAEFYGSRHIGAIKSAVTAIMVLGSAIGPGLTGWLIDLGIPFPAQMWGIAAYLIVTSVIVWFAVNRARQALPAAA